MKLAALVVPTVVVLTTTTTTTLGFAPQSQVLGVTKRTNTASFSKLYSTTNPVEEEKKADDKVLAAFESDGAQILGSPIPYEQLTIGVVKENFPGENRVSQTPDSIRGLIKAGFQVGVQSGGTYFLGKNDDSRKYVLD